MKLKYILIILLIVLIPVVFRAQVGINVLATISNSVLHIDAEGNNSGVVPSAGQTADDVLIDSQGRVAIGHTVPQNMLHIKTKGTVISPVSTLAIEDGSQGNTRVLMSDAFGNAYWSYAGELPAVKGVLGKGIPIVNLGDFPTVDYWKSTESYIVLPPGKWIVMVDMCLEGTDNSGSLTERSWVRSGFSEDDPPTGYTPDMVGVGIRVSGLIYPNTRSMISGFVIISNTTQADKKYYYCLNWCSIITTKSSFRMINFGGNAYQENSIVAFKLANN